MPFCMFNHPFLMAAVAVVAIGVVVYELIEESKRRQPTAARRPPSPPPPSNRPQPPPDDRPGSFPNNRPGPPPDNSRKLPNSQKSPPENNLRRRNVNKTSSKSSSSEKFQEWENLTKASSMDSENNTNKKFDEKNYCQNMLDKLTSDTKSINDNMKGEILGHNIYEEESDSSENNLVPKDEEKVINQAKSNGSNCNSKKSYKRKRKIKSVGKPPKNYIDKKHDNCSDSSDHHESDLQSDSCDCDKFDSQSSHTVDCSSAKVTKESPVQQRHASKNAYDQSSKSDSSNLYPKLDFHTLSNSESELAESVSSSAEDEDMYKKDLLKAFKNDLQNCEIIYNTNNSAACSSESIQNNAPSESTLCRGCEENHVNTRAYPCNHAYLCVDCAVKVFRLFKKCTICLQEVEEFVQFAI